MSSMSRLEQEWRAFIAQVGDREADQALERLTDLLIRRRRRRQNKRARDRRYHARHRERRNADMRRRRLARRVQAGDA